MERHHGSVNILLYTVLLLTLAACQPASDLPFTGAHAFIYDNDSELEGLDLPYALALASSGEIRLPAVTYLLAGDYPEFMQIAERSGLQHLPKVPSLKDNGTPEILSGITGVVLTRPESGVIEDTVPLDGASIRNIIREARRATPENPLVIATGGPLTNVASAWLLAPDIADRVIVSSIISAGANGWNDNADAWAKYIVLERLPAVVLSAELRNSDQRRPRLTEAQIRSAMPDTELRRYMIDRVRGGNDQAIDIASLMVAVQPGLVKATRRYSFSHWQPGKPWWSDSHPEVPVYKEDRDGPVTVITAIAPRSAFEQEYWRALSNPAAYASDSIAQQAPVSGQPQSLPGTLEAESYDDGGEGQAYHSDRVVSYADAQRPPRFRTHNRIRLEAMADAPDNLYAGITAGDWLEYTINNTLAGDYTLTLRARSARGNARVQAGLVDSSNLATFELDGSPDSEAWHDISASLRDLPAGDGIIRISVLAGDVDIDLVQFTPASP